MLNAVDNLFRQTAAVQRADLAFQLLTAGADRVAFRQEEGHAQRTTARDNVTLCTRIVFRHQATDNRVAPLVVRGRLFLRFRHHHGATFGAHLILSFAFSRLNPIDQHAYFGKDRKRQLRSPGSRGQHRRSPAYRAQ